MHELILCALRPLSGSGYPFGYPFTLEPKPHLVNHKSYYETMPAIIMDKGTRDQMEQMTASERCPKDTHKIRVLGSLESFVG
ncbi:hypothetical protein GQ457_04G016450 [Hibiscus cannabinus]